MKLFTIGFTQKNARKFFGLLQKNGIKTVVDIRLNNTSQLAAFAKGEDLKFFLTEFCAIDYIHDVTFAPTESLLKDYKSKKVSWYDYEKEFDRIMLGRNIKNHILNNYSNKDSICLLCSEALPNQCHRRLVANIFKETLNDVEIVHL
ncbi:MAG: DUF488 domain-containing protein [Clostridia bacterium]|nr:DUF488 domain-containing protein [Clostridia bacterium]